MADCDDDPAGSFSSVYDQVVAAGWQRPSAPRQFTTAKPTYPPLAVLMLPWDDEVGALETLFYTAASSVWGEAAKCVEEFVTCTGAEKRLPQQVSKCQLRCLIAGLHAKDPNITLAWIWTKEREATHLIPIAHECFNRTVAWLNTVPR